MKKIDFKEKTTEKLNSELKLIKLVVGMLIGVLTVLVAICVYGILTKEDNITFIALLVAAFSSSLMIPINFINSVKIKKELKSRA